MKKFVSLLICLSLVTALCFSAASLTVENYALFSSSSNVDIPINEHIGGDTNGDGVVNLLDVIAVLRATVGDYNNTSRDALDVNEDGSISVLDVILVIHHIVGNDVGLGELVEAK